MIQEIEGALAQILAGVTGIKRVVNYPVNEVGRDLPAVFLVYDGFDQRLLNNEIGRITLKWKATVVWPLDTKTVQRSWDQMKSLVPSILAALRNKADLGGLCHGLAVEAGEPVISTGDIQYIGHTLNISVWKVGAINVLATKLSQAEPLIAGVHTTGTLE
ncbi:hypothetical protein SAMN00808754_2044 [Thermanaeromonas toyohensis ToBE]|uniref:Uncharacterized protein n=2 Tax=Thermanaeromonas TaxID=202949 RepID=A0A1W1VX40_9FIRM|nr:hypothetical protein SAMN00808754_2044 [Thermanaeromonas toyohensis ToBE]